MISSRERISRSDVLILIAPGFEEGPVTYCIEQMRQAGLAVVLIGLSTGLVRSQHGMAVCPDVRLSQLPPLMAHQMVIVPGSEQCLSALLTEPRVHRLLEDTLSRGGYIAVTLGAQEGLLIAIHFSSETIEQVKIQGRRNLKDFVVDLLDLLLACPRCTIEH